MAQVQIPEMMEVGAHFGHQTRRWNPKMAPYIYASHNGVHIFDLVKKLADINDNNNKKTNKNFLSFNGCFFIKGFYLKVFPVFPVVDCRI